MYRRIVLLEIVCVFPLPFFALVLHRGHRMRTVFLACMTLNHWFQLLIEYLIVLLHFLLIVFLFS